MSATLSMMETQRGRRSVLPLSEVATANRQRDALYLLAEQLALADSAEHIHAAALQAIETALGCDRSSILLFDERGQMQFVAWHGLTSNYREAVAGHSPWRADDGAAAPIVMTNITTADLDPGLKATIFEEGIGALAFIPLQAKGMKARAEGVADSRRSHQGRPRATHSALASLPRAPEDCRGASERWAVRLPEPLAQGTAVEYGVLDDAEANEPR
jgi:hypothetical protein